MAYLNETPAWEEGIRMLETTDPVLGGPDGPDNIAPSQLANRTGWLKQSTLAALALAQTNAGAITDIDGRVARMENSLFNGITMNPFAVDFSDLDGLTITYGVWNKTFHYVEC